MKILYAIQGTGNGHLARATEIVPVLQKIGETDVLVSGTQGFLKLPFPVRYRLYGLSFIFGKKGGVNIFKTLTSLKPFRFIRDLIQLPVKRYDLVISDFEPVSAWSCRLKGKRCIGLSHQNAVLHPKAPKSGSYNSFGRFILKHYAPAHEKYGFHFRQLDHFNFTPVLRQEIRNAKPKNKGHYTVYLPAFSDEEIKPLLLTFTDISWEVFSKCVEKKYYTDNITFYPISSKKFIRSFLKCKGILCNAGFETPAEAIYMGKKLCVLPMKNQYEQVCNASFLSDMGIKVIWSKTDTRMELQQWLLDDSCIQIDYPDNTKELLESIITKEIILQSRTGREILESIRIPQFLFAE